MAAPDRRVGGAELLAGGDRPAWLAEGHFLAPTVLGGVTGTMAIYRDEIFGRVVGLIPFENEAGLLVMKRITRALD